MRSSRGTRNCPRIVRTSWAAPRPPEAPGDPADHRAGEKKLAPELRETEYFRNARAISAQLLGAACTFQGGHAIYKPPHNRKETPGHQDQAYWNKAVRTFSANFWMPLLDCPVQAGCMQFIPRSNLGDLLRHHPAGNDPSMHTLETDCVDRERAVACPLSAGGCTIHSLKTLHYTGPNATHHPRPAYILTFGYEWQADGQEKGRHVDDR